MHKGKAALIALCAPLMAVGAWTSTAPHPAPAPASAACSAKTDDAIPIADKTSVVVTFTEAPGDSLSASFPTEANVEVLGIKRGSNDTALSATLTVNTMHAVAGQWQLSVTGTAGMCNGTVWVGRGKGK